MKKIFYMLNLRKFDGESAGTGGEASGEATTSDAGENMGEVKVVYGKQATETVPDATETKEVTPDPEARKAKFEELVQGEYKDLYGSKVQELINKRFKDTKTLEKQLRDYKPILDVLRQKYGVSDGDVAKLAKAIEEDSSLYEEAATEAGLTVEQYKHQQKIEKENAEFRRAQEEIKNQRGAQDIISGWKDQAEKLKETFPTLSFDAEIKNPQFTQVLKATGDVGTAYKAVHFDEILPVAMQTTAKKIQEATVNNIQSRQSRPTENGASSSAGVIVKNDPSKWTDADIDDVINRVRMGEKINL